VDAPKLLHYENYVLLELPDNSLQRQEIETWIAEALNDCRDRDIHRLFVRRLKPIRLSIKSEDTERYVHLIDTLKPEQLRVAISFPPDYYHQELDNLSLLAQTRGIVLQVFFDSETAREWLLHE